MSDELNAFQAWIRTPAGMDARIVGEDLSVLDALRAAFIAGIASERERRATVARNEH